MSPRRKLARALNVPRYWFRLESKATMHRRLMLALPVLATPSSSA